MRHNTQCLHTPCLADVFRCSRRASAKISDPIQGGTSFEARYDTKGCQKTRDTAWVWTVRPQTDTSFYFYLGFATELNHQMLRSFTGSMEGLGAYLFLLGGNIVSAAICHVHNDAHMVACCMFNLKSNAVRWNVYRTWTVLLVLLMRH